MNLKCVYLNGTQLGDNCPSCRSKLNFSDDYTECKCSNRKCNFSIKALDKNTVAITYEGVVSKKPIKTNQHNWKKKNFYN